MAIKNLTHLARNLRKHSTLEEKRLWNALRRYPIPFHRQKVIGPYIVDFYCHQAKLAVEIDGSQHALDSHIVRDQERTRYLNKVGIQVVRFTNNDVYEAFDAVCEEIKILIEEKIGHPLEW